MLKEEPLAACEESAETTEETAAPTQDGARFRACLWLSLAADIRRQHASQDMKENVPC